MTPTSTKPKTINVPIDSIRLDGGTQVRHALDLDRVAHYSERLDAGDSFPSLQTFFDGSDHWLADGFHRYHAYRKRKSTVVQVDSRPGTKQDALWYALAANKTNGLPMNNADKAKAIGLALSVFPDLSNGAIAAQIGVADTTVARYRVPARSSNTGPDSSQKRKGKDGKMYPAPPPPSLDDIPMEDIAPPAPAPSQAETIPLPPPVDHPDEKTYPTRQEAWKTPSPPPTDDVGTPLPASLSAIFARRGEIKAHVAGLRATANEIRLFINRGDTLYSHLATSAFFAAVENAANTLKAAIPYAVCPYCRSGTPEAPEAPGCKACHGQGWVGELVYQMAPEETKPAGKREKK